MQESLHEEKQVEIKDALKETNKVLKENKQRKKKLKRFHMGLIETRAFCDTKDTMTNEELDYLVRIADGAIATMNLDEKQLKRLIKAIKKLKSMGITHIDSEILNLLKLVTEKENVVEGHFIEQYRDRFFGFRRVDTTSNIIDTQYRYVKLIEESEAKLKLTQK